MIRVPSCLELWCCDDGISSPGRITTRFAKCCLVWYPNVGNQAFFCVLNIYLGDSRRSISDFGCSEVEVVLAVFLKMMWKDSPSAVCSMFFEKIGQPTRRSLKLLASLVHCMKVNNSPDFSLPSSIHQQCTDAYFQDGFKQVLLTSPFTLIPRLPSGLSLL